MPEPYRRQEGQAALLALVALLVAGALVAGLTRVGIAASARSHVRAAADAAALAGAAAGPDEARRVAVANGARLVSYEVDGTDIEVVVEDGPIRALARARWEASAIP
jgi:Flp pilus assembly protein TadG